jgi:hypothetical protein
MRTMAAKPGKGKKGKKGKKAKKMLVTAGVKGKKAGGHARPLQLGRGTFRIHEDDDQGNLLAVIASGSAFDDPIGIEMWGFTDHYQSLEQADPQTWHLVADGDPLPGDFYAWASQKAQDHGTTIGHYHLATWVEDGP